VSQPSDAPLLIKGRLTPALKTALQPLEATDVPPETVLVARAADPAALHGFIARIEALGVELIELRQQLPDSSGAHGCPACGSGRGSGRTRPGNGQVSHAGAHDGPPLPLP
jgi:hypothetical protein